MLLVKHPRRPSGGQWGRQKRRDESFQAEDGIRDRSPSRGLGDVYKRQTKRFAVITTFKSRFSVKKNVFGDNTL